MKLLKIFLVSLILVSGCQKQSIVADDFEVDTVIDEFDSPLLSGDPIPSPHEFLITDPLSIE